ncbi:MAG TPA: SulP family inorganic anion transporter, partial [Amaricoccus sp.]
MTSGAGFAPRLRPLMAAAVVGPMAIAFNISAAGIVYQGPLTVFLDRAIGLTLIAAASMSFLSALLFSYRGTISQPQNMIAVILSIPAAGVAAAGPVSEGTFATVAALVAVTALATGVVTWLLGRWRLGFVARFIPFPVLAGFLAATGYMLVMGGLGMAIGGQVELGGLGVLVEPGNPGRWLPWAAAAVAIAGLSRRFGPMMLPLGLLVAAAVFYGVFAIVGLDRARDAGLLLGPFEGGFLAALGGWEPFAFDGRAILAATPSVLAAVGLSVVSTVLSASSVEAIAGTGVDPDRDLRAVGIVNLVAGAGGGPVGFHSLSLISLARGLGGAGRGNGWSVALACGLALVAGAPVISLLPVGLFSTGVIVIGLNLLMTPLVDQRRSLPAAEYAVVAIIPVAAAIFGFLWGVAVGLLAAALFFIMAFARIDLVRLETTAARIRSRIERPEAEQAWLAQRGDAARIYVLAGFVFFGTAHRLASRIEAVLLGPAWPRFVLIDFRQVRGIDVSAARSLVRLDEVCRGHGVTLVVSGLNPAAARLVRGQISGEGPRILASLAEALEEVEAALLVDAPSARTPALLDRLQELHPGADLRRYLREVAAPAGTEVIAQGGPSDSLLFLTSGMLRTELTRGDGGTVVIARCLPGALVGEIGLYAGIPRT